jgi:hypothetical protein
MKRRERKSREREGEEKERMNEHEARETRKERERLRKIPEKEHEPREIYRREHAIREETNHTPSTPLLLNSHSSFPSLVVEHDRRSTNLPLVVAAAVISSPATSSATNPFDTVRNSEQIPAVPVAVEATTQRKRQERGKRQRGKNSTEERFNRKHRE